MDISACLLYGWPAAEFSVGDTYESLQWFSDDIAKPTLQDIEAVWPDCLKERSLKEFKQAIQNLLDSKAQERNYRNQNSIVSYITSSNMQWSNEASAYILWRDHLWTYALNVFDQVQNEGLEITLADFLNNTPEIQWPN